MQYSSISRERAHMCRLHLKISRKFIVADIAILFLEIGRTCIGFNFLLSEKGLKGAPLIRGKTSEKSRKSKIHLWGL
jgi:hypothetical protein